VPTQRPNIEIRTRGGTRRAWIGFATIMMVALALGGCTPEQDIAQCELEAIRLYPNDPPKYTDDAGSRYVITCMKAKGYEFLLDEQARFRREPKAGYSACFGIPLVANPGCYESTGWRAPPLCPSPGRAGQRPSLRSLLCDLFDARKQKLPEDVKIEPEPGQAPIP